MLSLRAYQLACDEELANVADYPAVDYIHSYSGGQGGRRAGASGGSRQRVHRLRVLLDPGLDLAGVYLLSSGETRAREVSDYLGEVGLEEVRQAVIRGLPEEGEEGEGDGV